MPETKEEEGLLQRFAGKLTMDVASKTMIGTVIFIGGILGAYFWPNNDVTEEHGPIEVPKQVNLPQHEYRRKIWQLTKAVAGFPQGDKEKFVWEPVVLRPSEDYQGMMEIHGLADGKLLLIFSDAELHAIHCGDHYEKVYDATVELRQGNFVYITFATLDGTPERDFWFLPQKIDRLDENGQSPKGVFAPVALTN